MNTPSRLARRSVLRIGLMAALGHAGVAAQTGSVPAPDVRNLPPDQHFPFGPVVPVRRVSAWPVTTQLGITTDLAALLRGRVTAMQLMFTGCSATCPIQGALFAQAQRDLISAKLAAQFVSLSIDPLSDTPAALDGWLRKFQAQPGWLGVAPRIEDVAAITAWLTRGGEPKPAGSQDPHSGQVYVIDARGDLVFRLASMPRASDIVAVLRMVLQRR
jgi:protein SCO1